MRTMVISSALILTALVYSGLTRSGLQPDGNTSLNYNAPVLSDAWKTRMGPTDPFSSGTKTAECLPGWTLSSGGAYCTKGNEVKMADSVRKAVEQDIIQSLSFDQKKIDATFAYMRKHNLSANEVCKSNLRRNHEDYCQRGGL